MEWNSELQAGLFDLSNTLDGLAGADTTIARKIFIHVNNSNPILLDDSPERLATERAGREVAFDGMEIRL